MTDLASMFRPNIPFKVPDEFNTPLNKMQEMAFRQWVQDKGVPFDPNADVSDYDMRGFYQAMQSGQPAATSAVNPNDGTMHYPDIWKTPMHETFSSGSQWAGPGAPSWNEQDQLIAPGGRIVFDERNPSIASMFQGR